MKCFNHPEKDAVAICKSCNKALCHECASEVTNGIACKGKCEEEVLFLNEMLERNKTVYSKTGKTYMRSSIIYFLAGIAFAGYGFFTEISPLKPFLFIMSGVMIVAGILMIISAKKIESK